MSLSHWPSDIKNVLSTFDQNDAEIALCYSLNWEEKSHFSFPILPMKYNNWALFTIGALNLHGIEPEGIPYDVNDLPAYNKHFLNKVIENIDSTKAHSAVFDHDGTLVVGDISVAMMSEQISSFMYALPIEKKAFVSILSLGYDKGLKDECLKNGMHTEIGIDATNKPVTFQKLLKSIFEDYVVLKAKQTEKTSPEDHLNNVQAKQAEKTSQEDHLNNFQAKLGFYNDAIWGIAKRVDASHPCKHELGLRLLSQLWIGLTREELNTLIDKTWKNGADKKTQVYESTGDLQVIGHQRPGIKVISQQVSLISALQKKQVKVYIITAAPAYIVQQLSHHYGIHKDNVHGLQLNFDVNHKCIGVDVTDATYGIGKAKKLKELDLGVLVLASGDSMGDYEMLQAVGIPTGIKLIVNAIPSDQKLLELYGQACDSVKEYFKKENELATPLSPRILIQGVDRTALTWIPTAYSTDNDGTPKYTASRQCEEYNSVPINAVGVYNRKHASRRRLVRYIHDQ